MTHRPTGRAVPKRHIPLAEREQMWRRVLIGGTALVLVFVIGLVGYAIYYEQVLRPRQAVATIDGGTISGAGFLGRYRLRVLDLENQLNSANEMLVVFAGNPEFEGFIRQQINQVSSQLANPLLLGQQVLDELIEDSLISRELETRGQAITDQEVDQEIERGFGFVREPTATPSGTATATAVPTAFPTPTGTPPPSPTPLPTATPYTREAFESNYADTMGGLKGRGIREADFRSRIRAQLARERLRSLLESDIPHDEEQVWARHILVGDEWKALEIMDLLQSGGSWEELAARFSLDTGNRDRGGDLGWFPRGEMVAEFEARAFEAEVGQTVGPFHTSFGWHIVEVLGHEVRPLDDARLSQEIDSAFRDWLARRRSEADIQIEGTWVDLLPS
ncbi:MAG: peptidylprolyl isomerase [Anaerolineales bacterium]